MSSLNQRIMSFEENQMGCIAPLQNYTGSMDDTSTFRGMDPAARSFNPSAKKSERQEEAAKADLIGECMDQCKSFIMKEV